MEGKKASGSCLCGKITIHTEDMKTDLGVCHCSKCRKWSGGPFFAVDCGSNVKIDGKENLGVFDSSDWGERAFCKNCGTSLFFRLKDNSFYSINSELFNNADLHFAHQIFVDEKPKYYEFSNQTHNMTGEQVFAAFAPKE